MDNFKSALIKELAGTGADNPEYMTRDEVKFVLVSIADTVQNQSWLRLVVKGYLEEGASSWKPEDITKRLQDIQHDIKLLKLRLKETATLRPVDLVNEALKKIGSEDAVSSDGYGLKVEADGDEIKAFPMLSKDTFWNKPVRISSGIDKDGNYIFLAPPVTSEKMAEHHIYSKADDEGKDG